MRGGGEKSQRHHEGQLWPTDPKLPSSQKKAASSVTKFLLHGRAPSSSSPDPTAGVCFTFSANDMQMDCSSGCFATPTLRERERERERERIRKEKRRKTTSQGCVSFGRLASEASTAPFPVKGSLRLRVRGDPHYRIQGRLTGQRAALSTGCFNFLFRGPLVVSSI